MPSIYYQNWESFIANWFAGNSLGPWTDPRTAPQLLNDIANSVNSFEYIPEPWWGNHDFGIPLHSVVINFNPGKAGNLQLRSNVPYKTSYATDIVDSNYLPQTKQWHQNRRALPILNALKNIGALPPNFAPSIEHHLSIELIPWHTENIGAKCGFFPYLKQNIKNVYEHSICFAANESRRIANKKLKNVVILKLSKTNTQKLIKLLNGIGCVCSIKQQQTINGNSHCLEFSINSLPGIRFCSIWGSISRNYFPKDLDVILRNCI